MYVAKIILQEDPASICVSVAWDWIFMGVTEAGCRREMAYALECTKDNHAMGAMGLAPTKTCLIQVWR